MPRLYLIRHAEPAATWGEADPDPGLTDLGMAQAADAAMKLAALKPARILSSPYRRCVETAAALQMEMGLFPQIEPAFGEVPTPAGIADRRAWLGATFPAIAGAGTARTCWTGLGQDLQAWRARMLAALRTIDRDAAIFTHFIALNAIASAAQDRDETIVFRPAHASITTLDVDGDDLRVAALGAETPAVQVT
ncbi:MAG: histidine phosphatase family protein [Hydrogenophilaceae bacterium]|jgi:broad specificity phosphatase PhoE|nr:histidine phosphatase family protein [Hydrogenophilaceae bacterium]